MAQCRETLARASLIRIASPLTCVIIIMYTYIVVHHSVGKFRPRKSSILQNTSFVIHKHIRAQNIIIRSPRYICANISSRRAPVCFFLSHFYCKNPGHVFLSRAIMFRFDKCTRYKFSPLSVSFSLSYPLLIPQLYDSSLCVCVCVFVLFLTIYTNISSV